MQKILLSSFGTTYWLIRVLGRQMWFDTAAQFPSIEICASDDRFSLTEVKIWPIIDAVYQAVPNMETLRYINGRPYYHIAGKPLFCGILAFDS